MRMWPSLTVRQRLIIAVMLPAVVLTATTGALYVTYTARHLETEIDEKGLTVVAHLAPASEFALFTGNSDIFDQVLGTTLAQQDVVVAGVLDREGRVVAMKGSPALLATAKSKAASRATVTGSDSSRRAFMAPILQSPTALDAERPAPVGQAALITIGYAYVELDTGAMYAQRWDAVGAAVAVAIGTLALTSIPGVRLARQIGDAIARMANAIGHVAAGRRDVAIPFTAAAKELTVLERGFNDLVAFIYAANDLASEQIKATTEKLSYEATHDALTGLLNRRAFDRALHDAIVTSRRAVDHGTLCFIDLDHFKAVNDRFGHLAGDALLRAAAALIESGVRAEDAVFRIGGDEFAIILHCCSREDARRIAQGLCNTIVAFRFEWEGAPLSIGVSIGLARMDDPSHSPSDLLNAADSACYRAKRTGRNQICEEQ